MARGAEPAVLPGGGDLAERVPVEVALGVALLHRQLVQHVGAAGEQGGDGSPYASHMRDAQGAQERKDVLATTLNISAAAMCLRRDQRRSS